LIIKYQMKHKCEEYGYETNDLQRFTRHCERKIPCHANIPNKNVKKYIDPYCKECKKSFANSFSLKRHMKSHHSHTNSSDSDDSDDSNDIDEIKKLRTANRKLKTENKKLKTENRKLKNKNR
jgi:hypothetical protein